MTEVCRRSFSSQGDNRCSLASLSAASKLEQFNRDKIVAASEAIRTFEEDNQEQEQRQGQLQSSKKNSFSLSEISDEDIEDDVQNQTGSGRMGSKSSKDKTRDTNGLLIQGLASCLVSNGSVKRPASKKEDENDSGATSDEGFSGADRTRKLRVRSRNSFESEGQETDEEEAVDGEEEDEDEGGRGSEDNVQCSEEEGDGSTIVPSSNISLSSLARCQSNGHGDDLSLYNGQREPGSSDCSSDSESEDEDNASASVQCTKSKTPHEDEEESEESESSEDEEEETDVTEEKDCSKRGSVASIDQGRRSSSKGSECSDKRETGDKVVDSDEEDDCSKECSNSRKSSVASTPLPEEIEFDFRNRLNISNYMKRHSIDLNDELGHCSGDESSTAACSPLPEEIEFDYRSRRSIKEHMAQQLGSEEDTELEEEELEDRGSQCSEEPSSVASTPLPEEIEFDYRNRQLINNFIRRESERIEIVESEEEEEEDSSSSLCSVASSPVPEDIEFDYKNERNITSHRRGSAEPSEPFEQSSENDDQSVATNEGVETVASPELPEEIEFDYKRRRIINQYIRRSSCDTEPREEEVELEKTNAILEATASVDSEGRDKRTDDVEAPADQSPADTLCHGRPSLADLDHVSGDDGGDFSRDVGSFFGTVYSSEGHLVRTLLESEADEGLEGADEFWTCRTSLVAQLAGRPWLKFDQIKWPAFFLDPRTLIQWLGDFFTPQVALRRALSASSPFARMKAMVQWFLDALNATRPQNGLPIKPLTPVVGECYRCSWFEEDYGTHAFFVAECVATEPLVTVAFYVSSKEAGYVISGQLVVDRVKFWMDSVKVPLNGSSLKVKLLGHNEEYVIDQWPLIVLNRSRCTFELASKATQLTCSKTGFVARLQFAECHELFGSVKVHGDLCYSLSGKWTKAVTARTSRRQRKSEAFWTFDANWKTRQAKFEVPLAEQRYYESAKLWTPAMDIIKAADEDEYIYDNPSGNQYLPILWDITAPKFFFYLKTSKSWCYKFLDERPWDTRRYAEELEENFEIKIVERSIVSDSEGDEEDAGEAFEMTILDDDL